jgi:hypothetical protein
MPSKYVQPNSDELNADANEFASSVATIDADDEAAEMDELADAAAAIEAAAGAGTAGTTDAEWTGPRCEKCNAPMKSDAVAVCRGCGWYARLGMFVEVDEKWETAYNTEQQAAPAPRPSHWKVWFDMLPRWSWVILGTLLVIVVESIVVRLVTPAGSGLRTAWSLSQLAAGILAFLCTHIFNFVALSADDAEFGVLDLLLKPVKLWIYAARELPKRLWVANSAASGIMAALMSVLVIGGIPYERFWDWGFEAPVKQELKGAVIDRVKQLDKGQGADNLEDAIDDFAGSEGELNPEPPKPREKADCVILGYQLDRDGRLKVLVLGTTHLGRLVYAGNVTPKMSGSERAKLLAQLAAIKSGAPLIPIQSDSTVWVKPKYACRVSYSNKERGKLHDVQWDRMLGSMDMPSR